MPLTIHGSDGEVWSSVTGADSAEDKGTQAGGTHLPPAATQGDAVAQDVFVVPEKLWGPPDEQGTRRLLHQRGERIPMARAIELGLVEAPAAVEAKKEHAVEDKKAPRAATKRSRTTKK